MTDQHPNALRERELRAAWESRGPIRPEYMPVSWFAGARTAWDRAWSKCSEVAEVSIRELTAELEDLAAKRNDWGRIAHEDAIESSQLRATVERVRVELQKERDRRVEIRQRNQTLNEANQTLGKRIALLERSALVAADLLREWAFTQRRTPWHVDLLERTDAFLARPLSATPVPAVHDVHEEGDCRYAESLIEQLDEALCTLLHSGDELGEHSPESHLALFHEQQRDRKADPAPDSSASDSSDVRAERGAAPAKPTRRLLDDKGDPLEREAEAHVRAMLAEQGLVIIEATERDALKARVEGAITLLARWRTAPRDVCQRELAWETDQFVGPGHAAYDAALQSQEKPDA